MDQASRVSAQASLQLDHRAWQASVRARRWEVSWERVQLCKAGARLQKNNPKPRPEEADGWGSFPGGGDGGADGVLS